MELTRSKQTNLRTDDYGGNGRKRIKLLFDIADAIRKEFPLKGGFVLGVKLNASDYIVSLEVAVDPRVVSFADQLSS